MYCENQQKLLLSVSGSNPLRLHIFKYACVLFVNSCNPTNHSWGVGGERECKKSNWHEKVLTVSYSFSLQLLTNFSCGHGVGGGGRMINTAPNDVCRVSGPAFCSSYMVFILILITN